MRAIDIVRRLCPHAHPNYVAAFENGDSDLAAAGVVTPLRLAHFLAQAFHETDGLTILEESLNYSAKRMTQVWPRRFPTIASAEPYAHNPKALAEHTYGGRMGNGPEGSGDGYRYIGRGIVQCTGKSSYADFGRRLGIDLVGHPELASSPEAALKLALAEWTSSRCNEYADRNAILQVSRAINVGNPNSTVMPVGYAERVDWFDKVWAVIGSPADATSPTPSWQASIPDPDVKALQEKLVVAGYPITVDGRKGPETVDAIKAFQAANGLVIDGVAGPATRGALDSALATTKAPRVDPPSAPVNTTAPGLGLAGLGEAGQQVIDKTSVLQPFADAFPVVKWVLIAATVAGFGLIVWGLAAPAIAAARRKGAPS